MNDGARRRRNIQCLGLVLFIGIFMPICGPRADGSIQFGVPNIEALYHTELDVGFFPRFMLAYPLIACAVLFGLAYRAKPLVRAIGLILLGVLPWVLLWGKSVFGAQDHVRSGRVLASMMQSMEGGMLLRLLPLIVMGNLAWFGLFVGTRARWYRPSSQVAHAFGVGGAAVFIACFVVTAFLSISGLLTYDYYSALWAFRRLPALLVVNYGSYAVWALTAVVSVLCLLSSARNDADTARRRAGLTFRLFLAAHGVLVLVLLVSLGVAMCSERASGTEILGAIVFLKLSMMGLPMILLIPVGLSDLVVGEGEPLPKAPVMVVTTPPPRPPALGPGGTAPA